MVIRIQELKQGKCLPEVTQARQVKVTLKRHVILFLFCLNAANKSFQYVQVPASTTKAAKFYQVQNYAINCSSLVALVAFMFTSWPVCFLIERIGLRKSILFGSFGAAIGTLIKCNSYFYESVFLLIIGNLVVSLSEQLVIQLPLRLVSVWFPDDQLATGLCMCQLSRQVGASLGFQVTQFFVGDASSRLEIGFGLRNLFLASSAYSFLLYLLNYFIFEEEPKHPPGLARRHQMEIEEKKRAEGQGRPVSSTQYFRDLFGRLVLLLRNRDLVLVAICYGLNYGRMDAMITLMDQTLRPLYSSQGHVVSNVGSLLVAGGALGSLFWGRILDKFMAYKNINLGLTSIVTVLLSLFAYAFIYAQYIPMIYATSTLMGLFNSGLYASAMQLAAELTYPASEVITSSLLYITTALLGSILIVSGSYIVDHFGALPMEIYLISTLVACFVMTVCVRERLRRQEAIAEERKQMEEVVVAER